MDKKEEDVVNSYQKGMKWFREYYQREVEAGRGEKEKVQKNKEKPEI